MSFFADISQVKRKTKTGAIFQRGVLKPPHPVVEKKQSFHEAKALTCLKASQVSAGPPAPQRFMCAIHESADVTILMIIMMAVFIYLQR